MNIFRRKEVVEVIKPEQTIDIVRIREDIKREVLREIQSEKLPAGLYRDAKGRMARIEAPKDAPLVCNVCGFKAKNLTGLYCHKRLKHERHVSLCDVCGFKAKTPNGLKRHKAGSLCKHIQHETPKKRDLPTLPTLDKFSYEFIDPRVWNEYLTMRKTIKHPLTEYGKGIAIKKLIKAHSEGYDPNEMMEESIFKSWQGLFTPKENAAYWKKRNGS